MKQAIKKGAGIKGKSFDLKAFKENNLSIGNVAEKPMEWFIMPKGFSDALGLPGIPKGYFTGCYGWNSTGKSTIKNCLIAAAQRQGVIPVIFETESNFDFNYAISCGMDATPIYGTDEETGEEIITDYEGNFILFTNETMCEYCGDIDYSTMTRKSTKRSVALIEDIAYIINDLLDKQEKGELPVELLFVWDSVGSIQSWKSYQSKCGNNMFDAGAINTVFKPIFARIAASKEVGTEYTNTMFVVNKIWKDSANSVGGAVAIANSGGEAFQFGIRLGIHVGGAAKAGTKKLKATLKGEEYQYGNITKVSIFKNQLPVPYNITYSGTMCCVHNGIISEDDIDNYKKTQIPLIIEKIKQISGNEIGEVSASDVEFTEEGTVE